MKKFKDKKEAEQYVRNWVPSWHCPLQKQAPCSTKCVCFVPPHFVERQTNDSDGNLEYVAQQDVGYCTAYCVVGPDERRRHDDILWALQDRRERHR